MIAAALSHVFKLLSHALHRTPLRRVVWVTRLHSRVFAALPKPSHVQMRGSTIEIDPRDQLIAKKLVLYGAFEDYLGDVLISLARRGTAVLDIGANIGIYTLPLARRVGNQGRVIAFEPDPDNYAILMRNITNNDVFNVQVYKVALSSHSGEALLYQDAVNRGALSLCRENLENSAGALDPVKVQVAKGDEILAGLDKQISLIKVDVEGAEPLVLEGLRETLRLNPSATVVFEFLPRFIANFNVKPDEFLKHLEQSGFRLAVIREDARRVQAADARAILAEAASTTRELNLIAHRNRFEQLRLPD